MKRRLVAINIGRKMKSRWDRMGNRVHRVLDSARPRGPLSFHTSPSTIMLQSCSNTLQMKDAAVGKITALHFHPQGKKKALLIAVVFHTGTTSIPLSPALKHLQNKQGE